MDIRARITEVVRTNQMGTVEDDIRVHWTEKASDVRLTIFEHPRGFTATLRVEIKDRPDHNYSADGPDRRTAILALMKKASQIFEETGVVFEVDEVNQTPDYESQLKNIKLLLSAMTDGTTHAELMACRGFVQWLKRGLLGKKEKL
jgi:hypothetical protein